MASTRVREIADRKVQRYGELLRAWFFVTYTAMWFLWSTRRNRASWLFPWTAYVFPMRSAACCHESALARSHSSRNRGLRRSS
jgi:hypothetical protein